MGNSWQDSVEEKSKKFLAVSKEQIDYYLIHKEFAYIKKRSLSTVNNLKHNFYIYNSDISLFIIFSTWKMRRKIFTNISTIEHLICSKP